MKLLSCHIQNYGKMHNADFKFDTGLTSFCEANGYGKTTLASFLKAMFYGLDSDRANSAFNERRHFNPFGGGNFGGYVTFMREGKVYKIERYFDEKSETKDSVTLYINGKITPAPENLGESIFGIDRQSFERTIFISAAEIEIASTGSINTKLNNFIEGSTDDTNLEAAVKRLEDKSKTYKKSRAGSDLISEETRHINRLTESISNIEVIQAGLPAKYARHDAIAREIRQLTEEISKAQGANLVRNDWEHYDQMTAEVKKTEDAVAAIESRYPYGVPFAEEIDAVQDALERDKTLKASGQKKLFSEGDEAKYSTLFTRFGGGMPEDDALAAAEKKIQALTTLAYETEALGKIQSSPQEEKLRQRFLHHVPSQEEVGELRKKAEAYKAVETEYESISDYITGGAPPALPQQKAKPSKMLFLIAAILSALLLAGGIGTAFVNMIAGIILIAVGAIGLLVTGFLYLNKKTNAAPVIASGTLTENPQKAALGKKKEHLYAEIQAFLMPYGYSLSNGVAYAVATFEADVKSYRELLASSTENGRMFEEKQRQTQKLAEELTAFFARYKTVGESYVRQLSELRSDMNTYRALQSRRAMSAANESELQAKIAENRKEIASFCAKYRFDIELIAEKIKLISNDRKELMFARKTLQGQREKARAFQAEKGLEDRPEGQSADLMELNERLSALQEKKNALLSEITGDEYEVEKLSDLRNELEGAREKLESYKTTYDLLTKTMDALKEADRKLKDKYVKPIKDTFTGYASALEKALGEKITMGADFEVRYESFGRERSEKHLSSGQRSICALCFRLALIDNMYAAEKPFLILDDPFTSLDEAHLQQVKVLLKELSKKLQIVYFSCHPSRKI